MKYRSCIFGVLALFLWSAHAVQAKEWRGITPLKSTRTDVERLLGKPNGLGRYEFKNERAYIDYAAGCDQLKDCLCLVPEDTVINIFVTLEIDLKFSDLNIDRTKYKKGRGPHLPTIVTYTNDEEGVIYTVDDDDNEVVHITYLPKKRDCQNIVNRRRAHRKIIHPTRTSWNQVKHRENIS